MTNINIMDIPSEIVRKAICETIKDQLNSKYYDLDVSLASSDGDNNFIGILYRISFRKREKNAIENTKNFTHKSIVKIAPQNLIRRARYFTRPAFVREIYMYENVLPFFRHFEQSKGVTLLNGFHEYATCFKTVDTDLHECLVLDDLSVRGFTAIEKDTSEMTVDHVRMVMCVIAKFHAISFALKDQQPERFVELTSNLDEILVQRDSPIKDGFKLIVPRLLANMSEKFDSSVFLKIKNLFERDATGAAADCLDLSLNESATVISHGDLWHNNLMFRYDSDGKPIEVNLLDWQLSRHASPMIDIVYFLFICTTKEIRDAHYDEFLRIYHETLSAHIKMLGSDPVKLFPYEMMLEHLHKFGKFGLILATLLVRLFTLNVSLQLDEHIDANDEKRTAEMIKSISQKSRENYMDRMRGIIIDMVELEYI